MPHSPTQPSRPASTAGRFRGMVTFLQTFVREPNVVGSLVPSSRFLADALLGPFRDRTGPATLLEVGAGTGPVTARIGSLLGPKDELDVVEILPALADHLDRVVLAAPEFAAARREGRVRLFTSALQDIDLSRRYDFVVSGLPLTAFNVRDVRDVLRVVRSVLKPGGVLSYFEYVALRRIRTLATIGEAKRATLLTSRYLDRSIKRHQFRCDLVIANVPPAFVRCWRFDQSVGKP